MNLSERLFATAGIERRFRRNYRAGVVMGVCAGLADTLGIDRTVLRFVALLLVWFATVPTLLLYLLLAWLGRRLMNAAPHQTPNPRRLYRDTENGMIAGVCAGIADYFGFSVGGMRGLMVLMCFFGGLPVVVVSYIAATVLLQKKPVNLYRDPEDEEFWQSVRRDPHFTCDDIRRTFRDLDRRLQGMEQYVTSPRFDLDQEFNNLD